MTSHERAGYHGVDLLRAASAATERAPQLADEIRGHAQSLAKRVSAGEHINTVDIDVRTLVGLIEQAGVQVPMLTRQRARTLT